MNILRLRAFLGRNHILVAAVLIGCYWLAGCTPPWRAEAHTVAATTPQAQADVQAIADAQAGLDAFSKAPGVTYDENAGKILAGVQQFNKAAAGNLAVPAPRMSPEAILADPDSYHSAAVAAREKAEGIWGWVKLAGALGMLTTVGAAVGRLIPGVGPWVQPVASLLGNVHWFGLSSEDEKQAEADQAAVAGHAKTVVSALSTVLPDYRNKFDPKVVAAIDAVLSKAAR